MPDNQAYWVPSMKWLLTGIRVMFRDNYIVVVDSLAYDVEEMNGRVVAYGLQSARELYDRTSYKHTFKVLLQAVNDETAGMLFDDFFKQGEIFRFPIDDDRETIFCAFVDNIEAAGNDFDNEAQRDYMANIQSFIVTFISYEARS